MNEFRPVSYEDGYLPIEDHGLIGDGSTAALIGRDGAVSWMRAPRFDSPPIFCRLLDAQRGGAFTVAPEDLAVDETTGQVIAHHRISLYSTRLE